MPVADTVAPLVCAVLGDRASIRVTCWDGSTVGAPDAPLHVVVRNRRGLRRVLWAPNELGFARAYVAGDIDVEGDLIRGLQELARFADPEHGPRVTVDATTKKAILRAAVRLRLIGLPPAPPPEEVKLTGHRHSRIRDATAVSHHYDVGNDFYRLVLGESMVYSCAYWAREPSAEFGLADAQLAKCDLVARKLGLAEGMRVLDVGCGWGTFARHAARCWGARVVGVTLSREQAAFARERISADGLADRVEIRVQDYRDVDDGPYDAIASIGMAEHVGAGMLPVYAADLFALLRPGGRLLNHAIARRPGHAPRFSPTSFIDRYVFPDGELVPPATTIETLEDAGFEVRDVESLREHYALTLREWVANLERSWDGAARLAGPARARIWRLYMAGSSIAFDANRIGVNQVLAIKTDSRGRSGMPRTRNFG